jgi:predicted GIY-YIG superfamily endonuclease
VYRREGKIVVEEVKSKATAMVRDYPLRRKLIKWKLRMLSKQEGVEYVFNEIK